MRPTLYRLLVMASLCLVGGILYSPPVYARVDIPLYPGANNIIRKSYQRDHFPPDWVKLNADSATVVVYQLPRAADADAVADFYSHALEKVNWTKDHIRLMDGERYIIFNREGQQLVIHIKDAVQWLSVDALGLEFPGGLDGHTGGKDLTSFSDQTVSQVVDAVAAGATIHIVCPAGAVHISAHTGPKVQLTIIAHAAVGYPELAAGFVKSVQVVTQNEATGLSLGVDAGAAGKDTSVRFAYEYNLSVPVGVNVMVEVQHPVDPIFRVPDGKVEVHGAVGNVNVLTDGPVDVNGASGNVSVVTSDDPVLLVNLSGNITVHTTNMWIKAMGIQLNGDVEMETSGDQIEVHLSSVQDGSMRLKTVDSSIRLWMPVDASADVNVVGAEPTAPFPLPSTTDSHGNKRYHAPVNGGKIRFDLETSGGGQVYIQNK